MAWIDVVGRRFSRRHVVGVNQVEMFGADNRNRSNSDIRVNGRASVCNLEKELRKTLHDATQFFIGFPKRGRAKTNSGATLLLTTQHHNATF